MKGVEDEDSKNTDDITFSTQTGPAWADSERDYTYDEVNGHIYYSTGGAEHMCLFQVIT